MPKKTDKPDEPADEVIGLVDIPFRGHTFVVPKSRDDWPTAGLAFMSEGKYNLFVKSMLDIAAPRQWTQLCEICPRRRDFTEFWVTFAKVTREDCVD